MWLGGYGGYGRGPGGSNGGEGSCGAERSGSGGFGRGAVAVCLLVTTREKSRWLYMRGGSPEKRVQATKRERHKRYTICNW
ncbi:unnamed protein product [Arabis nemorensis]|uniref:Uncharacterized protein n=1 Tax=Arabis nemorensis TaxID=586526 RepID=A0A565APG4_9BRAS|nr:unnamed protein product [Arabis nemorensis]